MTHRDAVLPFLPRTRACESGTETRVTTRHASLTNWSLRRVRDVEEAVGE